MYCLVRFLNGFTQQLTYQLPEELIQSVHVGSIVVVPLRNQERFAQVIALKETIDNTQGYKIKALLRVAPFPPDALFKSFSTIIGSHYFCSPTIAYEKIYYALEQATEKELYVNQEKIDEKETVLTEEQQAVVDYLSPLVTTPHYEAMLLHGVTGSGKTEVYKKIIAQAIREKKSVLMILPEVSLALQFVRLFKEQLPNILTYGFHSAATAVDKKKLWQALCTEQALLIIGVHMPIFLPISNLGLIIIDEEHERGFTEKRAPYLNSKEIALWRAHTYKIPILMGSATPSTHSWYHVNKGSWKLFTITKRFSGAFPTIHKVILSQDKKNRRSFWISTTLEQKITETLAKKEQAIIYLNRRGHSFFVQCKKCGTVIYCPSCSVSLTYHLITPQKKEKNNTTKTPEKRELLRCHYCDYSQIFSSWCNQCSSHQLFIKKGIGTQQGVTLLQELFPQARIAQADLDITKNKKEWSKTVAAFSNREIDILVGTQTISKGYHFPGVTLVGILWADMNLHFPLYYAAQESIAQLIQVAGRAGRQSPESSVVIQAINDHSLFNFLREELYQTFCEQELQVRAVALYPPIIRMLCIELRSLSEETVLKEAEKLYQFLVMQKEKLGLSIDIKRPTMPLVHRINKWEMRHLFMKAHLFSSLKILIDQIDQKAYKSSLIIIASQL